MAYASVDDVQARMSRTLTGEEETICESLLEDAAVIIDAFALDADVDVKQLVSVRMVVRSIGVGGDGDFPIGTTQGSQSALGYSASFTIGSSSGSGYGELYLAKIEKQMLGMGNKIGTKSPIEHRRNCCSRAEWWWESLWH